MKKLSIAAILFLMSNLLCGKEEEIVNVNKPAYEADTMIVRAILDSNGLTDIAVRRVATETYINDEGDAKITQLDFTSTTLGTKKIHTLTGKLGNLTELILLKAGGNQIAEIPHSIGSLKKLNNIDLSGNNIAMLPSEIGQATALEIIHLESNNIAEIPAAIGSLVRLEVLALDSNSLHSVPSSIGTCANLATLKLGYNQLSALPLEIANLTKLAFLDVDGNKFCPPLDPALAALLQAKMVDLGKQNCQ